MKQTYQTWIVAGALLLAPLLSQAETAALQPAETKQARDARMAWWREARFGMFVHWGLYSGLAGNWEGKPVANCPDSICEHNKDWKTPEALIQKLVDIASKGGNLLLNIGPKGDGSIPKESIDGMNEIGRWMKVNSEAIYGTSATVFGAELGKPVKGKTGDGNEVMVSSAGDWRCTTKPGKIYLHLFKWPANSQFDVPGLQSKITKAYL